MFFSSVPVLSKGDLEHSGITKLSNHDSLETGEELGHMEFEPITIKIHR